MRISGSALTSFDPEIERTAHAIKRAVREENITQWILVEDHPLISSDSEEEFIMVVIPPQTMGDLCKRTDEGQVSRGFIPAYPTNFDIKNFVLSGYNKICSMGTRFETRGSILHATKQLRCANQLMLLKTRLS